MKIAIVGLGLIGGSFAKALRARTGHAVLGLDADPESAAAALRTGAVERLIAPEELSEADLTVVALYPEAAIGFLTENARFLKPGSLVIDTCGVKKKVVDALDRPLREAGLRFVGCHPMAGREFSGFDYALEDLFDGASFLMTPTGRTDPEDVRFLSDFALSLGFGKAVTATPEEHDRIIAYTSQLAHLVSNAYVKSPTLRLEKGFSAGSFKDLTRVAKCSPEMWTALFLDNREALLGELDGILASLSDYREALAKGDPETLRGLLQEGNDLKEWSLRENGRQNAFQKG